MSYILTIDVGNSRTKFGLLRMQSRGLPTCERLMVVPHGEPIPWDGIHGWNAPISSAIIAGSNPDGVARIRTSWPAEISRPPRIIESYESLPLRVELPEPGRVGIDRLLNGVAANILRRNGQPAVIVDSGTATTVDAIDASGTFVGGAILPGFELSARALHQYTALLPLVSIKELASTPNTPIGKNTTAAVHSGLFWGQVGAIREILAQMRTDLAEPLVLLTGGGSRLLEAEFPAARREPALALCGMALASGLREDGDHD